MSFLPIISIHGISFCLLIELLPPQLNHNKVIFFIGSCSKVVSLSTRSKKIFLNSNSQQKSFIHHSPDWPILTIISLNRASHCKTLNICQLIISDPCQPFTLEQQFLLCRFKDSILSANSSNVEVSISLFKRKLSFHNKYFNTIPKIEYSFSHHFQHRPWVITPQN